jgi:hypothetical protein
VQTSLLQDLRALRSGGGIALVLAFLLLPYLIDVAYYGDFTPTHYAQENIDDEEGARSGIAKASLLFAVDQANSGAGVRLPEPDVNTQGSLQVEAFLLSEYLFLDPLTSRPPPLL